MTTCPVDNMNNVHDARHALSRMTSPEGLKHQCTTSRPAPGKINNTPGAYHRRSRSTRTLSTLTSSQLPIWATRSLNSGANRATDERKAARPDDCTSR